MTERGEHLPEEPKGRETRFDRRTVFGYLTMGVGFAVALSASEMVAVTGTKGSLVQLFAGVGIALIGLRVVLRPQSQ